MPPGWEPTTWTRPSHWWTDSKVPIWGIIPERVGIAAGPEARLYRDGLEAYDAVLKKALRKRSG